MLQANRSPEVGSQYIAYQWDEIISAVKIFLYDRLEGLALRPLAESVPGHLEPKIR